MHGNLRTYAEIILFLILLHSAHFIQHMDNILVTENVEKCFAGYKALTGVSLSIPSGKIFGLIGQNGAGKTTLIRIINRITAPDSGRVVFEGRDMKAEDVLKIGYLPEERGLYRKMKVGEQALYLAMLKGMPKKEAEIRLKKWFEKLAIESWWNRKLEELSKGMQQKVQFIITVVHEPPLLIFDEPFSGFDPVNAETLKREMLELRDKGHTIIYSTHNMESVEEMCDNFALINKGHVVLSGNVGEVRRNHREGIFNVVYEGNTELPYSECFEIVSAQKSNGYTHFVLKKNSGTRNSELAGLLSQYGELTGFSEKLPTMNDIFIKTVSRENGNI